MSKNKANRKKTLHKQPQTVGPLGITALPEPTRNDPLRFIPVKVRGLGGLCEVFEAIDTLRAECCDCMPNVAVKRLLPEYADNPAAQRLLVREFFMARSLAHPGIIRLFDLHRENGQLCLSMELLEGDTLRDTLARRPSGLGREGRAIASALFDILYALHRTGMAHGDIKPGNLSLERGDRVVLFDFNTAEPVDIEGNAPTAATRQLLSCLKIAAFSPQYASPERQQGAGPSLPDDVFAACCTTYELLTGEHPWRQCEAVMPVSGNASPLLHGILPLKAARLLLQGLSIDPAARPHAAELCEAFHLRDGLGNRFMRGVGKFVADCSSKGHFIKAVLKQP